MVDFHAQIIVNYSVLYSHRAMVQYSIFGGGAGEVRVCVACVCWCVRAPIIFPRACVDAEGLPYFSCVSICMYVAASVVVVFVFFDIPAPFAAQKLETVS